MPKTNADGVPSFADARGTDALAESATGQVHLLDPTAHVDDEGKIVDNDDLTIEGDEREQFESREEREQREQREREEAARAKTGETLGDAKAHEHESGDFDEREKPSPADRAQQAAGVKTSPGTSSKASSKPTAKTSGSN